MTAQENPSKNSVKEIIREDGFMTYAVRFDINDSGEYFYDMQAFANALFYELADFAHGGAYWKSVTPTNPMEAVSEAAKSIYKIPAFKKLQELYAKGGSLSDKEMDPLMRKGEFGELILFFLLKNFNDAIPLLSKIYFKDADGMPVHGFDAVHLHEKSMTLWLGESKMYENSKIGLKALIQDTKDHIASDYLKREFTLIGKKFRLAPSIKESRREKILNILTSEISLENKIKGISIPLLCTFNSKTFTDFDRESKEFLKAYEEEMRGLKEYFHDNNDHPLKEHLNIILILMPIKSKKDLVAELHKRLTSAQALIQ